MIFNLDNKENALKLGPGQCYQKVWSWSRKLSHQKGPEGTNIRSTVAIRIGPLWVGSMSYTLSSVGVTVNVQTAEPKPLTEP